MLFMARSTSALHPSGVVKMSTIHYEWEPWQYEILTVKLGPRFCKYFLTINDLYNGAKSCNSPPVVVEI